jgi:hypothetical protein
VHTLTWVAVESMSWAPALTAPPTRLLSASLHGWVEECIQSCVQSTTQQRVARSCASHT